MFGMAGLLASGSSYSLRLPGFSQWHCAAFIAFTVAGQRRICTFFPILRNMIPAPCRWYSIVVQVVAVPDKFCQSQKPKRLRHAGDSPQCCLRTQSGESQNYEG